MVKAIDSSRELRNDRIDFLKGLAIIAVVLYHLNLLEYGYLGVDIFLVINGYFVTKGLKKFEMEGKFSFWKNLSKRVLRIYPLVLVAGIVCLIIGFFVMLPDDFENLAASIIASNCFSNNILAAKRQGITGMSYNNSNHLCTLGIWE